MLVSGWMVLLEFIWAQIVDPENRSFPHQSFTHFRLSLSRKKASVCSRIRPLPVKIGLRIATLPIPRSRRVHDGRLTSQLRQTFATHNAVETIVFDRDGRSTQV